MIHTMYYTETQNPVANAALGEFVSLHTKSPDIDKFCSMGVFEDGKLIAATLYHNYHPTAGVIELSSASISKRWLTKDVIRKMFFLPFDRLECQMVVLRVSESNEPMIKIARKFGFSEVFIPRLSGRNEGSFVFSLTDDDWRNSPYRKEN